MRLQLLRSLAVCVVVFFISCATGERPSPPDHRPAALNSAGPSNVEESAEPAASAVSREHETNARKAERPLTNEDVIKLSKLGLGDGVVTSKIRQAPAVTFELDVDGLQKLKDKKVSNGVIAAMLERASSATRLSPSAPRSFSPSGKVWLSAGGKFIEARSSAGYVEASIGQAFKQAFLFSFTNKFAVIARGAKAKLRLTRSPDVIYTRHEPSEVGVARLTVQQDDDRRFIWVVARVGSNEGEFYPEEDNFTFQDEIAEDGVHNLTLARSLPAGEYALIAPGGNTGYLIYDFGIDAP